MKEYYLELAGLRTVLRTPWEITISNRIQPFLSAAPAGVDCTVTLSGVQVLPEQKQTGHWYGMAWYEQHPEELRIFHCDKTGGTPFACVRLLSDGNVELWALEAFTHYFSGTAGIFNRIGPEALFLQHGGLLLHSSFVRVNGGGLVFAGPSGVGKSTQAALWQEHCAGEILNGDRTVLRCPDGVWTGYGSPYAGTSGIYRNESAKVKALTVLRQAEENRLERISPIQALQLCWPELSVYRWDQRFVEKSTDLFLQFAQQVPVFMLSCRPDREAVLLLKEELAL